MYVLKADYKSRIDLDLLDRIIKEGESNGDDLLAQVSKMAEDIISTSAGVLYSIAPEFAKVGTERNYLVLMWALNIATYNIYQRTDDEEVPAKVIKNYDDTMDDLVKVSRGQYTLNLPARINEPVAGTGGDEGAQTDGVGLRRMGSQQKRSHML